MPEQNWLIKQTQAIGKPVSWGRQQETKLLSFGIEWNWDEGRKCQKHRNRSKNRVKLLLYPTGTFKHYVFLQVCDIELHQRDLTKTGP